MKHGKENQSLMNKNKDKTNKNQELLREKVSNPLRKRT